MMFDCRRCMETNVTSQNCQRVKYQYVNANNI